MPIRNVTDKPVGVRLLGRDLVLARLDDELLVLPDTCRHFQARLSLGEISRVNGQLGVQCPYHGWTFGRGGRCLRIPQLPASRSIPRHADMPAFRATERHGLIWVCLRDDARFPIPEFPEFEDEAFRKVWHLEPQATRTSAPRMIMATLDNTHFPWVHEGILGDKAHPEPPQHRIWRERSELLVQFEMTQPANRLTQGGEQAEQAQSVPVVYTNYVGMPNVIRLVKESAVGRYVIWLATSPADYHTTINFWIIARNFDLQPASDAFYEKMSTQVRDQDRPIVESQRPWLIPPFSSRTALFMGPGDLPLIEYQKWLEELGITAAL
jgi:vanillate O-demethylase monooxygenase subunit